MAKKETDETVAEKIEEVLDQMNSDPEQETETPPDAPEEKQESEPTQQEMAVDAVPNKKTDETDSMVRMGDFDFRATLTGVKTKATKDGLRKVLTFESKNLHVLRDVDQYLEQDFNIEVGLTFGHYVRPDKPEPQKGEEQQNLPLDEEEHSDQQPDETGTNSTPQESDTTESLDVATVTDTPVDEGATDTTQGGIPTEYICEPCSKTEEIMLVTVEGDEKFLMCPVCSKVYANPGYKEPEV